MTYTTGFSDIPAFSAILTSLKGNHPDQVYKFLAWEIAKATKLRAIEVVDQLEEYGRRHTPGMGDGVAMYDWKQADISEPVLIFARLETPTHFNSLDDRPVDIIVTLVSPEADKVNHLRHLSRLARIFRDGTLLKRLRDADCADGIAAILAEPPTIHTLAA